MINICVINMIFFPGTFDHPYDPHFKKFHKMSLSILKKFGYGQRIMENRIHIEVEELVDVLSEWNGRAMDPSNIATTSTLNVIVSIIFGRRFQRCDPELEMLVSTIRPMVRAALGTIELNVLPCLRFLPSYANKLQQFHELNETFFTFLEERVRQSLSGENECSFISCFVQEDGPEYDHKQLLFTLRDLLFAGTETTSTTLLWFLVYMANNPDVQTRLQKEIDAVVPRSRYPSLDDKSKLTYVEATTLEMMRIRTIGPLAVPHQTMRDTEVAGFFIPANCVVSIIIKLSLCHFATFALCHLYVILTHI